MKNNIKRRRKALELTQNEVSKILDVSRQTINCIENNKYNPTLELAMKIARLLNTTVDELFTLDDE